MMDRCSECGLAADVVAVIGDSRHADVHLMIDRCPDSALSYVLDTLARTTVGRLDLIDGYCVSAVVGSMVRPRRVPAKCPQCGSWGHSGFSRDDLRRYWSNAAIDAAAASVTDSSCSLGGTIWDDVYDRLSAADEAAFEAAH